MQNSLSNSHVSGENNTLPMRPASKVMQLDRLGSLHQSRLSFMRTLVRRMVAENWQISAPVFYLDEQGFGKVVYQIQARYGVFSFVVFSHYLDPECRNDRVIADQWDLTMALCEGTIDSDQLSFLQNNVPKQEAGRVDSRVLVLSRANRSARTFEYVVDELSNGRQPNVDVIAEVGYLYRTTAAYGSGKLGMADWEKVWTKHRDFARPFAAEMFTCYLLRHFSIKQAEFLASKRDPQSAVEIEEDLKRYIGIGNSTGLGMAPFLINHPLLINQWIEMRETALARVVKQSELGITAGIVDQLAESVSRVLKHLSEIITEDERQSRINTEVGEELKMLRLWLVDQRSDLVNYLSWEALTQFAEDNWHIETQEVINTLLIELYPELVDDLEERMWVDESYEIVPEMSVADFIILIETKYDWALSIDFSKHEALGVFWYRSEEKMEPRLGNTGIDIGMDKEMPLGIARRVRDCYDQLCQYDNDNSGKNIAHFIVKNPTYNGIVARIQTMSQSFYGDIRENLVHKDVLPINLLRCKLSFFGVSKFDPRSRLWVRNTMFQGAPLVDDFGKPFSDNWHFPIKPAFSGD
ncbi:MAG: hypothetical protein P8H89_09730 [Porticoccaceae bacterium]|nr:hypothetical protein [Porticoccaceae bacterium]